MQSVTHISAITLIVEDLAAAKKFYRDVFASAPVHEDASSSAFKFDNVIVNLLRAENAREIIEPGVVAPRDCGSRFQLSIWVDDVDAVCAMLQTRGVKFLTGTVNRPWGMRTATFVDPAGHSWEVAQRIDS